VRFEPTTPVFCWYLAHLAKLAYPWTGNTFNLLYKPVRVPTQTAQMIRDEMQWTFGLFLMQLVVMFYCILEIKIYRTMLKPVFIVFPPSKLRHFLIQYCCVKECIKTNLNNCNGMLKYRVQTRFDAWIWNTAHDWNWKEEIYAKYMRGGEGT
jgi:hypothetical protein